MADTITPGAITETVRQKTRLDSKPWPEKSKIRQGKGRAYL